MNRNLMGIITSICDYSPDKSSTMGNKYSSPEKAGAALVAAVLSVTEHNNDLRCVKDVEQILKPWTKEKKKGELLSQVISYKDNEGRSASLLASTFNYLAVVGRGLLFYDCIDVDTFIKWEK